MEVGESRGKCSLEVKSRHFIGCLTPPFQHLSLVKDSECPAMTRLNNIQKWARTDNLSLPLQRITFVLIIWVYIFKDDSPWTLSVTNGKCQIPSRRDWSSQNHQARLEVTLKDKFDPTFHEKGSQGEFIQHPVQSPPPIGTTPHLWGGCSHEWLLSF